MPSAQFSPPTSSAPLSLMTTYRMSLISAGAISLDSTFKLIDNFKDYNHITVFMEGNINHNRVLFN
jgi:hypothetical protein